MPGKYGTVEECVDCTKGGYCEGGVYTGPNTPIRKECPANMTTLGVRATSIDACGEDPRQALSDCCPPRRGVLLPCECLLNWQCAH